MYLDLFSPGHSFLVINFAHYENTHPYVGHSDDDRILILSATCPVELDSATNPGMRLPLKNYCISVVQRSL